MKKLKFVGKLLDTYVNEFKNDIRDNNGSFRIVENTNDEWRVWSDNRKDHEWILRKSIYKDKFVEVSDFEITIDDELFEL